MRRDQFSIYRVNVKTDGWKLKGHSYEYVRNNHLNPSSKCYKQIYLEELKQKETADSIMKRIRKDADHPVLGSVGVSDVLVLNYDGEIQCYYIDTEKIYPISEFISFSNNSDAITYETKGYEIRGVKGKWDAIDYIILDGNQYYLMENQKFRDDAANIILDAYGKMIVDQVDHGFDDQAKLKIRIANSQNNGMGTAFQADQKKKYLHYQKFYENGTYERRAESGTEANYNMIDGQVNNQKKEKTTETKKPKKRTSVIRKLRLKQIAIAKKSGRPVPMYLQEAERKRN